MRSYCPKCGTELASSSTNFCPGCGTSISHVEGTNEGPGAQAQTEAQSAKAEGVFDGCLTTGGKGVVVIAVGILLCLTGIGAVVGVPLILFGLLSPFIGALLGWTGLKGQCPWCAAPITSPAGAQGIDCPACKKRIVIRDRRFIKIG
jgi:uncharacterized Zn finger protein (UPF0148 family)